MCHLLIYLWVSGQTPGAGTQREFSGFRLNDSWGGARPPVPLDKPEVTIAEILVVFMLFGEEILIG